jgi:alkanesulfonate monooxygenase SsuD/methylene tetrahydromethanopterin reductase-like flavin-dependent oxidoreductase (luciferase family)
MELATLARLFPGRFTVALGHGVQDWMRQVGAAVESPMTLLREHTTAVRDLLAGQTVDVRGRYVSLHRVALDWPPQQPPRLLVGATGPRTIRLAGELSDGVLLTAGSDADAVRRAREIVGTAQVAVYAETNGSSVGDRVAELAAAGADAVILQGTDDRPGLLPLIEALAG